MLESDLNPDDWYEDDGEYDDYALDDYADRLNDEVICGDITEGQARARMNRAIKRGRV